MPTPKINTPHKHMDIVIQQRKTGKWIAKYYADNGKLLASSRPLSNMEDAETNVAAMKGKMAEGTMVRYPDPSKDKTLADLYAQQEERDAGH